MRTLIIVLVACPSILGCGSSETHSSAGLERGAAGASDGGTVGDHGVTSANDALDLVLNEVLAVGASEWIEIANKGRRSIDISNYAVADSDKKTKEPKRKNAMRFPAGTTVEPAGRILILTSKKNAPIGPHPKADCLPDGPETCFFAAFGVSATGGETLHVLAPDGSIVTSTALPPTASADAGGSTNESECRIPDLTGDFTKCTPTPGRANAAR